MRLPVSLSSFVAVAAFVVCTCAPVSAQESSSQTPQTQQPTTPQPAPTYVVVDPLALVRYDNRYDITVSMAYDHIKAGPNLLQGANLGGLNFEASYWLTKHWGLEGTGRAYVGTSGAAPNAVNIDGPFVAQYLFAAGPEWLGPHNKHGDLIAHVLVGGAYGDFQKDLRSPTPVDPDPVATAGFYNNQVALAVIMGGHFDLNRSEHWVFRLTPDAVLTDYGINYGAKNKQIDINAAFSVGVEYKFKRKR